MSQSSTWKVTSPQAFKYPSMSCRETSPCGPNCDSQHSSTNTWPTHNKPPSTLIHTLDDDSLLSIFSFCRPLILDENKASDDENLGGQWSRERWWYRLVHVCRRWRDLMLQSPSYLRLSLLCTRRTPVADMLANSPHLPLIIDYLDEGTTTEDEEGIILALQHHDRVRHIRLRSPISKLQKAIISLDGEFPILEYLLIHHKYPRPANIHDTRFYIPETFRAPNLRHLSLMGIDIPVESSILTTMGNLVTLNLDLIQASAYFHTSYLLGWISRMPQLEILRICFGPILPSNHVVERQLLRAPIMTHVTLPDLRWFGFSGSSDYLEALLPWVNFPPLEKVQIYFFRQPTYSIPHLERYIGSTWNFRPITITLNFYPYHVDMTAHSPTSFLSMGFWGQFFEWQVVSAAQVFHTLRTVFSAAEHLTLQYTRGDIASFPIDDTDRTQWRKLLRPFSKVKTILVDDNLVEQFSHSLQPGEGESPIELLPELQELSYRSKDASCDVFAQFIDARQKAGHPVTTVIRY